MLNRVVSVAMLVFIAASSIVFFLLALLLWAVTVPFDRRLRALHLYSSFWASVYVWIMPAWKVKYLGREKIRKDATYVVVSNHQSQLDILVAFGLFFHFKWVSKAEVFKTPLIGWDMVLNRYIKLVRGDRESVRKMMEACEKTLAQGSSVYFFPEGTRSKTGRLKSFKPGAFVLAKKMKTPILPIAINGTMKALPKHSVNFHGTHPITVEVLDEVPYASFENTDEAELAERVRGIIAAHVKEPPPEEKETAP